MDYFELTFCVNITRLSKGKIACSLGKNSAPVLLPGPSRRLTPVIKCNAFLCFQSYIVRDISLTEIYRWLVTFIEILSAILKSTRYGGESRERL